MRKQGKKKIEKTRGKAIKGLIDFNKFIRANVVGPGQRRSFDFRACNVMSNKKSSTGTKDEEEKKKARNLYKALTNDSESVFYATNKITKTLVKKARNSLYRKGCLENCP